MFLGFLKAVSVFFTAGWRDSGEKEGVVLDGTVSLGKGCFGSRGLLSGGMKALKPMLPCPGPSRALLLRVARRVSLALLVFSVTLLSSLLRPLALMHTEIQSL